MDIQTDKLRPSPDYMDNYRFFGQTKNKRKSPGYSRHLPEARDPVSRGYRQSSYMSAGPTKNGNFQSNLKLPRGKLGMSKSNYLQTETPQTGRRNNPEKLITPTKCKPSYHLPMVYFIVKNEVLPVLPEQLPDKRQKASLEAYATKSLRKFLHIRSQQKHQRDAVVDRAKRLAASVGMKVGQAKTHVIPVAGQCLSDNLTTPCNTMSERSEDRSSDTVFLNQDDLTGDAKPEEHACDLGEAVTPRGHHLDVTPRDVEILEQNPKEPYTISDTPESFKKVHFTAKSRSKSCDVQLPLVEGSAEEFHKHKVQKTYNDTTTKIPPNLSISSTPRGPPRRAFNPIKLPKIDLLAPIYDELILKTFQAFMSKNSFREKSARALIQRVSAFLHPTTGESPVFSLRKTPSTRPQTRETSFFSTEPDDPSELQYIDLSNSNMMSIDGKSMSVLMRDVESRQRRSQLQSTCFLMPPPGLDRAKTDHYALVNQDTRPDIYIPSSS